MRPVGDRPVAQITMRVCCRLPAPRSCSDAHRRPLPFCSRKQICPRICARDATGHPETGRRRRQGKTSSRRSAKINAMTGECQRRRKTGVILRITQRLQFLAPCGSQDQRFGMRSEQDKTRPDTSAMFRWRRAAPEPRVPAARTGAGPGGNRPSSAASGRALTGSASGTRTAQITPAGRCRRVARVCRLRAARGIRR